MVAKALDLPVSSPTVSDKADSIHVIVPFKHQSLAHCMCPNQRFNSEDSYDRTVCLCQTEDLEILACKTI